jgi:putative sterol carrier protein
VEFVAMKYIGNYSGQIYAEPHKSNESVTHISGFAGYTIEGKVNDMTYEELITEVKQAVTKADASNVKEHVAFQFNVTGDAKGAFYLEISEGKIKVEPYEYYDRDALITSSADNIIKIMKGKLDPVLAFTLHKIKVEGDLGKALLLKEIVKTL